MRGLVEVDAALTDAVASLRLVERFGPAVSVAVMRGRIDVLLDERLALRPTRPWPRVLVAS